MMLSQSSSGLSQIVADVHRGVTVSTEALCMELLGVLKRALTSQWSVRLCLYRGLKDVVDRNPDLCLEIIGLLHQHSYDLRLHDTNAITPIDMDSLLMEIDGCVHLVEPLGWFFNCLQQLLAKGLVLHPDQDDDEEDRSVLDKVQSLMDNLVEKYSNLDTGDLNFEKGANYSKGKLNFVKVEAFKNVYEAFMAYVINHGLVTSSSKAQTLIRLQKKHEDLNNLLKNPQSSKTGGKRKAGGNDTIEVAKKAAAASSTAKAPSLPEHAISLTSLNVLLHAILL